jgi:hypothetical protein
MTSVEDRVREAFSVVVAPVRPQPQPLARLLARRRRTWRVRLVAGAAALLALGGSGGALLAYGGGRPDQPTLPYPVAPTTITSEWVRTLLATPTRGNAAANASYVAALTAQFDRQWIRSVIDGSLDRIKVLAVADLTGARIAVAAFYNDTHGVVVATAAKRGAGAADLAAGELGSQFGPLDPFVLDTVHVDVRGADDLYYTVALPPAGCRLASSTRADVRADGTVLRTWRDEGEYLLRDGAYASRWWQVTCGGLVREQRPGPGATGFWEFQGRSDPPPAPLNGAQPMHALRAVSAWRGATYLLDGGVSEPRVVWGGLVPGDTDPTVVLAATAPAGGVVACAVTWNGKNVGPTIAATRRDPLPPGQIGPGWPPASVVTTAVGTSSDLIVVRLPNRNTGPEQPTLSSRILVIGPANATRAGIDAGGAADHALESFTGGIAVFTVPAPTNLLVQALDAKGDVVASTRFAEPAADGQFFGEPFIDHW